MPSTRRRPLLIALTGGAAAVGTIGAAARTGLLGESEPSTPGQGQLQLSSGGAGVSSLDVELDNTVLEAIGPGRWQSARLLVSTFSMVGFTWRRGDAEPHIQIRARRAGAWQDWRPVSHVHEPDPDSHEVSSMIGTDLVWVGRADAIQLRVSNNLPAAFTLALLHPTPLPSDRAAAFDDTTTLTRSSVEATLSSRAGDTEVPRPAMRWRRDWGADESWRSSRAQYNDTIKQVHVHHTVNSNTYTRTDVPALIRGMYRYHTHNLGWSDIGYNFLIDRFGRIWVGRAGGPGRPVRGAHTLGFNHASTGVSVIGNFEGASPPRAVIAAIARLAAWKLDKYGRDPQGRIRVRSEGSDKYRSGQVVTLPVIDGHRDTNDTACPGRHLYDALPRVRRRAARRIAQFHQ